MSECVTTAEIEEEFAYGLSSNGGGYSRKDGRQFFREWLDKEHRDAHAAAIRDAATELLALDPIGDAVMWDGHGYVRVYDWLLDRAQQIEEGNHDHL